ncbi:MAG: hypothetical protein ACI89L_002821, partial [Phycisphaerales bacterium]
MLEVGGVLEHGGGGSAGGVVGAGLGGGELGVVRGGDSGEGRQGLAAAVGGEVLGVEVADGFEQGQVAAGARGIGPGEQLREREVEPRAELERGEVFQPEVEQGLVVGGVGERGGVGKAIRTFASLRFGFRRRCPRGGRDGGGL